MKCPNCGSSAQPKVLETKYVEDGWTIKTIRTYKCGCCCIFTGISYFICLDERETAEKILRDKE